MSRKSILAIVVGLFAFAATLAASDLVFSAIAPSGAEIMAEPQTQIEKLQLAETIQTTFLFVAILELIAAGALAYQWRKADAADRSQADGREESQKGALSTFIRFSAFTGIIAFVTSYVAALLDVFVFDLYGGLGSNVLMCPGIPAGLFGMLGGFVWYKITRKSKSTPGALIPLILIGILTGMIPSACIKMLPQ